ncbi:MAG: 6,7-dimethyl-8-ribityllumazine synthase [Acidobacteriota bacterium]
MSQSPAQRGNNPRGIVEVSGQLDARGKRFGLVAARFNERVVSTLIDGALDCLRRHGAKDDDLVLVRVPGAWEIPAALRVLAQRGQGDQGFDALVALGVVIRGETPHFDYVCSQCASGITAVSSQFDLPIGMGVLTCDTPTQAQERAGGKAGNKGWEAAEAALEMADLLPRLRSL